MVGRNIGRYRILEQLGQGGMSVVYKGLDTSLDREVAVKVLHPHLSGREESRKRLAREAKAVARLRHPNILEVFDFAGDEGSEAYIVCEYIRGRTLRQFLAEQTLQPPEVAAMVVHEIAAALAHAHESGVIHRDLKPENVMLREDGVLKLMDFGIAKIIDRDEKMTMTGALVGSPAHMAPEIIEGEEAGPEADVFSLGTMLYLFATGRLPFTANNTTATLKRILDGVYDDPRRVEPAVSDELAEIIATCLMRQPKDRYPNATRLRDALADYLGSLGLTRPAEELAQFFLDPPGFRKAFLPRLTGALLARAEKLLGERRPAKALALLNLVLAHDPQNARTVELLAQMKAQKVRAERLSRLRRVSFVLGALIVSGSGVARGIAVVARPPDFELPAVAHPTDVAVPHVDWPRRAPAPAPAPVPAPLEAPPRPPEVVAAPVQPRPRPAPAPAPNVAPAPDPGPRPGALVEVEIRVRPFGNVQVDQGPAFNDVMAQKVQLAPGRHRFKVSCSTYCEENGRTQEVQVPAEGPFKVQLVAPLRRSLVSFAGFPDDAVARIDALERPVQDTRSQPFEVTLPPEGRTSMRHQFNWEVTRAGKTLASGKAEVAAGSACVLTPDRRGCEEPL